MNAIRVLSTGANSAAYNMALDEALMHSVRKAGEPVLRFYSWKPAAVSIGNFQGLEEEVDTAECRRLGIDVVRRQTGGGAVFHESELTYSFISREFPKDILESYKWVCSGILLGLKGIGIDGQFVPLNDLVWNGKKFSGNAQTRKGGVMLQHGTVLLQVDVDRMFSVLKVPNEKMKGKLIEDVKQRVTGIGKTFAETEAALRKGFASAMAAELYGDVAGGDEKALAAEIMRAKYADPEWTGRR